MRGQKAQQLAAVFLLGLLVFNYPLLSLFGSGSGSVFGVPLLYAWLFLSWLALIGLVAWIVER